MQRQNDNYDLIPERVCSTQITFNEIEVVSKIYPGKEQEKRENSVLKGLTFFEEMYVQAWQIRAVWERIEHLEVRFEGLRENIKAYPTISS